MGEETTYDSLKIFKIILRWFHRLPHTADKQWLVAKLQSELKKGGDE